MTERPPHVPSELEGLLLRAALLQGPDAVDAWERSKHVAEEDVNRLDKATYRLLPQLYRNLLDQGVEDPLMPKLKGIYRHAWYTNQRLFHEAGGSLRVLADAGVPTMVMKGASLTQLYYRDPGARPMEDLDVVVHADDALRAMSVLEDAGWRRVREGSLELAMRTEHATEVEDPRGRQVDLHWSPLWETVPEDGFWERAVPVTVGSADTLALSPTDELIQTIVHGLGWFPAPVRWITDSVAIVRASGDQLDWDALADRAERWSFTARLDAALTLLRQDFDVPVPDETLARLRAANRPLSERVAHRALLRGRRRGLAPILHWDRHRRRRDLGIAQAGLPTYMRDALLWGSWLNSARLVWWRVREARRAPSSQPA